MAKKAKAGTPNKQLGELLIALAIDDEFRDWFNRDRAAAIASRKLPKSAVKALTTSDPEQLRELLFNNQAHQTARRKATRTVRKTAKKR